MMATYATWVGPLGLLALSWRFHSRSSWLPLLFWVFEFSFFPEYNWGNFPIFVRFGCCCFCWHWFRWLLSKDVNNRYFLRRMVMRIYHVTVIPNLEFIVRVQYYYSKGFDGNICNDRVYRNFVDKVFLETCYSVQNGPI